MYRLVDMTRAVLASLCLALALSLALAATPALAYSSSLYADATCTYLVGEVDHKSSGSCFHLTDSNSRAAKATCTDDGRVSAVIYEKTSCSGAIALSGKGLGNGMACVQLTSAYYQTWSMIVDCSAPGGSSSTGPSTAVIAGAVIGSVLGAAALAGLYWYYRKQMNTAAAGEKHSVHMQQQYPADAAPTIPARTGPSHYNPPSSSQWQGAAPGPAMAVVCRIALLQSLPGVAAAAAPVDSAGLTDAMFSFLGESVFFMLLATAFLACCYPQLLVRFVGRNR